MSKDIYILDAVRTPIGIPYKGLKDFSPAQMAAKVIAALMERSRIPRERISEVIFGNTVSAGQGQNLARQAVVLSGLPLTVPAFTINVVCGSGLQSVILGAQSMRADPAGVVISGGTESVSRAPYLVLKGQKSPHGKDMMESPIYDGLLCLITGKHMGRLCEDLAAENGISRREQDLYSLESHRNACAAQAAGKFDQEITPMPLAEGKFLTADERPRKDITLERLQTLPPAFDKLGTVTAGNASAPCDGAAAVILASGTTVKKDKLEPMARILGYVSCAVDPAKVFTSAIAAIPRCLEKSRLKMDDMDLFEVCESFSAQAILTRKTLNIPPEKMNIFGGDVALGHPLGAAGARILVTLLYALKDQKKKRGLAAVCLGGGGAVAMAVERF